jgi:hypothetical protein
LRQCGEGLEQPGKKSALSGDATEVKPPAHIPHAEGT